MDHFLKGNLKLIFIIGTLVILGLIRLQMMDANATESIGQYVANGENALEDFMMSMGRAQNESNQVAQSND